MKPANFLPVHKTQRAPEIVALDVPASENGTLWKQHLDELADVMARHNSRTAANLARYKRKNYHKIVARKKVHVEVRAARLKRKPCHRGKRKVEGHHRDYNKPLDVIWLCKKHHAEADKLDKATIPIRNVSTTVQ